jgi:hypothetical protein
MIETLALLVAVVALAGLPCVSVCKAPSLATYELVLPPSANIADSRCARDGGCDQPDSTWLPAGSYLASADCNAAIAMAQVTVTDANGNTSTNDCSQTAQCIIGPAPQ